MAPFDPSHFWTELPTEIIRLILSAATRERETIAPIRSDHSDVCRILAVYERDQRVVGALRATNKGQPFRFDLRDNHRYYYELTQDVWKLRDLHRFRLKLDHALRLNRHQVDHAYLLHWFSLNATMSAIRDAAHGSPRALRRALCALKASEQRKELHERAHQPPHL